MSIIKPNIKKDFERMPLTITICSGKGGVGKSVVSANLGSVLSKMGHKVLIWDADSFFPNLHLILGIEPPSRLSEVYSGDILIQDAIYRINDNFFILADSAAMGSFPKSNATPIIDVYKELLLESDFDIIIFDSPAGASEQVIQCSKISDIIAVMINDEPTSLLDAYGLIKVLLKFVRKDKIYLLVNNVIDIEDAEDVSTKLNSATNKFLNFEVKQLGFIPYERNIRLSIQRQELYSNLYTDTDVISSLKRISEYLTREYLNFINT